MLSRLFSRNASKSRPTRSRTRRLSCERFEDRRVLSAGGLWGNAFAASDNSTRSARDVGTLGGEAGQPGHAVSVGHQYVGPFDQRDVFRFAMDGTGEATLSLKGLSADADLYVLNSQRQVVAASYQEGWRSETIQTELAAGEYFAVVEYDDFWRGTSYSLDLAASYERYEPIDTVGDTFATAQALGSLRGTRTIQESVGRRDQRDVYQFVIDATSRLDIRLQDLQADVDVHLYSRSGVRLASSTRPGRFAEQINAWIASGEYYLVVEAYSPNSTATPSDSTYTLTLRSSLNAPTPNNPPASESPSQPSDPSQPSQPSQPTPVEPEPIASEPTEPVSSPGGSPESGTPTDEVVTPDPSAPVEDIPSSQPLAEVPYFGSSSRDWGVNAVAAPEAWAAGYTGEGITVAVIDSGIQTDHLDLQHSIWVNVDEIAGDGIDNDNNGYVDDVRGWDFVDDDNTPNDANGHGTHVAGIIAADRNLTGATGVAYAASILPIRVLDASGSGSTFDVARGIRYAVDNGADIINLSLGGGNSQSVYAALRYAEQNNVLVVAASGNETASVPGYPAAHSATLSHVVSVGAFSSTNRRASFSNRVGNSNATQIDAPGQSIYSTYVNSSYRTLSGTSMAAPFVSGVAALAWAANPSLSASQLRSILTESITVAATGSDSLGNVSAALAIPLAVATPA